MNLSCRRGVKTGTKPNDSDKRRADIRELLVHQNGWSTGEQAVQEKVDVRSY
jgi:hypothetical protein